MSGKPSDFDNDANFVSASSVSRLLNRLSLHADLDLERVESVRTGTAIFQMEPKDAGADPSAKPLVGLQYYEMRRIQDTSKFDVIHAMSAQGVFEMRIPVNEGVGIIDAGAIIREKNTQLKHEHGGLIEGLTGGSRFVKSPDLPEFERAIQQRVKRSSNYGLV